MGYEDMTTSSVILGDNPTRVSLAIDAWLYGEFVLLVQDHVKAQSHPDHVAWRWQTGMPRATIGGCRQ
jgi:hypothetical protein